MESEWLDQFIAWPIIGEYVRYTGIIEQHMIGNCTPAYRGTIFSRVFLIMNHFSMFLGLVLFCLQLIDPIHDLYYPFGITAGSLSGMAISYIIRLIINESGPMGDACAGKKQMPNDATFYVFFLATMVISFPVFWKGITLDHKGYIAVVWLSMAAAFAPIYVGLNSETQILWGAWLGTLWGLFWQWVVYRFIHHLDGKTHYTLKWCIDRYE